MSSAAARASEAELIVVRHGETEWNATGRQQGHLDSPLTAVGIRQAQAIAAALRERGFDAIYSSDLGRAYHTAECIAAAVGRVIVADARLRERHLGVMQGLTIDEVQRTHAEAYAGMRSGDPDYVIPEGESDRQRCARCVAAGNEIAARHAGQRVVIVAHGGTLSALFRHALNIDMGPSRRYKLFNASINTFFVAGEQWTLGTWGDVHHLAGIGTIDDW